MARLYRPHIPLSVRCAVAERQIGCTMPEPKFGPRLKAALFHLAAMLKCEVSDLRLDHDPPLAARPQERRGLGRKTYYVPDANDPDHLFYRPHGPEHAGSHLIKTNVRGDHGQHPDRVLIKKAKRLASPRAKKPSRFSTLRKIVKPVPTSDLPIKSRWQKRKFPSRRKP